MKRAWIAMGILSWACLAGAAGPVRVDATLEPPATPYHLPAHFTLTVETPSSVRVEFPDLQADGDRLEARKLATETRALENGSTCHTQQYALDAVFPGTYLIPPLNISFQDGDNTGVIQAAPMAFTARELTDAEREAAAAFGGITTPASLLPKTGMKPGTALLGAVAVLAAAAALLFLYRRRKSPEPPAVVLPPWKTALNRLRELQRRDLPAQGRGDAYYVDLSSILRYYIEDRFLIRAPEQTTPEFLEAAVGQGVFTEAQQQFLEQFLRQCDRVKFALLQPGLEDMSGHFQQVKHFIQETIPDSASRDELETAA